MPLTLYVDGDRWRDHLRAVTAAHPGIVPVAKGNGYGFGIGSLARRAEWLGVDTLAVGTYAEVAEVEQRFKGEIVVLEPWRPQHSSHDNPRIIHTVGRSPDLEALAATGRRPRVVLEGLTSMRRHGFDRDRLHDLGQSHSGVRVVGHALHLPFDDGNRTEAEQWLSDIPGRRWFVSHLSDADLRLLGEQHPNLELRPRIGTALWLGDRSALVARSSVIDVHPVSRGDRVGYRQRRVAKDGLVVVLSGGTAHGIGLEAPAPATSTRQRAIAVAKGGLEATGRALSPFTINGKQRWFVEPPHMQASMVFVPAGRRSPAVGDEVDVNVRFTTTSFDEVQIN